MNKLKSIVLFFLFLAVGCAGIEPSAPKTTERGPPPSLQKVWGDPALLFKEAQKYYQESNYSLSLTALERILTTYPKSGVYEEAKKLADDIQSRLGVANFKIGVVLPLSGSFARFGESALNGIACAVGLFDPCGGALSNIQIVVRDTKGNPSLASEAIRELVEKEAVAAIIGPLISAEGTMAASQAQTLNVPMIVLAPQEGVTQGGNFIFQHSLRAESEVSALVQRANKAGLKKFIILYPKNRYGEQYHNLFVSELQSGGEGKIIAETGYVPDIPDFMGILERLKQRPAVEKALIMDQAKKVGIFIPDSYRQIAQIAQSLDSLKVVGPKLIGTSRWHHPHLLTQHSAAMEGALMDTPFYPESNRETARQFSSSFYRAYGNAPAWLEAFAYDATRLILHAYGSKGNNHPPDIRDALLNIQDFQAVVGPFSWDGQRISKWPLDFITVQDGKFSLLK